MEDEKTFFSTFLHIHFQPLWWQNSVLTGNCLLKLVNTEKQYHSFWLVLNRKRKIIKVYLGITWRIASKALCHQNIKTAVSVTADIPPCSLYFFLHLCICANVSPSISFQDGWLSTVDALYGNFCSRFVNVALLYICLRHFGLTDLKRYNKHKHT